MAVEQTHSLFKRGLIVTGLFLMTTLFYGCSDQAEISVLSFNIRYANPGDGEDFWEHRKEQVAELIKRYDADFVGLQEALPEQIAYLVNALPAYQFIWRTRELSPLEGEAVPLMYNDSVWDLESSETFWLSDTPEQPGSNSWQAACNRVSTWGIFYHKDTGKKLLVCNTHFDHISQNARINGANLILARLDSLAPGVPVILMGDLNGKPDNPAVMTLTEKLQDPYPDFYPDDTLSGTFHGFKGNPEGKRIDYILVSDDFTTKSYSIIRDHIHNHYPSDHFPVFSSFTF